VAAFRVHSSHSDALHVVDIFCCDAAAGVLEPEGEDEDVLRPKSDVWLLVCFLGFLMHATAGEQEVDGWCRRAGCCKLNPSASVSGRKNEVVDLVA